MSDDLTSVREALAPLDRIAVVHVMTDTVAVHIGAGMLRDALAPSEHMSDTEATLTDWLATAEAQRDAQRTRADAAEARTAALAAAAREYVAGVRTHASAYDLLSVERERTALDALLGAT